MLVGIKFTLPVRPGGQPVSGLRVEVKTTPSVLYSVQPHCNVIHPLFDKCFIGDFIGGGDFYNTSVVLIFL